MGSMRPDRVASYVEQMAMIFPAKKFIRSALARYGYRLVPIEEHDAPTGRDAENAADLLQAITPEVQANAATGTWPTPAFIYGYFSPHRLAMVRLLLEQCEAADIEIAGKRVLDVGRHAGCLLRLIAARYPDATRRLRHQRGEAGDGQASLSARRTVLLFAVGTEAMEKL